MLTAISLYIICQRNEIIVSDMPKKVTTKDFIEKATKVHNGKYDYSKTEYKKCEDKVCITCPIHGDFYQNARSHINGYGCPKCGSLAMGVEEFISRAREIHGDKYDYSKVEYKTTKIKVCIICPEHGEFWQTPHAHLTLKQGCWECYLDSQKRGIYNVGINDVRNSNRTKAYGVWHDLIARCCDAKYKQKYRCYKDCTICKEWLTFSIFKDWFDKHYIEGWQLDKDMLVKGNKLYSPETCCFLPRELNNMYKRNLSDRTLPQCCRLTDSGKYSVDIQANKHSFYLGTFETLDDAFFAYKTKKEELIRETAKKYKSQLEKRVLNALLNFKIDNIYSDGKNNE